MNFSVQDAGNNNLRASRKGIAADSRSLQALLSMDITLKSYAVTGAAKTVRHGTG